MLWQELESVHADKSTFVPTIAGVIETWCHTLSCRLEDDKYEDWTETFLEKLVAVHAVKLLVHVIATGLLGDRMVANQSGCQ